MTRRVAIGNFADNFLFRVSKAGTDAVSGPRTDMILHEDMIPLVPIEQGQVTIAPGGNINDAVFTEVTLSRSYAYRPFVVLRCDKNFAPSPATYMARISGRTPPFNKLRIYNCTGYYDLIAGLSAVPAQTLTIKYAVFREVVPT